MCSVYDSRAPIVLAFIRSGQRSSEEGTKAFSFTRYYVLVRTLVALLSLNSR